MKKIVKNRKKILIIITSIIILLSILFALGAFDGLINTIKLRILKYDQNTISIFKEKKITEYVIVKNKYSKTLEVAINSKNYNPDNLDYYLSTQYIDNENFITNLNNLAEKKYTIDDVNKIFKNVDINDITTLTEYDYNKNLITMFDIKYYKKDNIIRYLDYNKKYLDMDIKDILTRVNINLDYNYYENTKEIVNKDDTLIYLNKYNYLKEDYEPNDLMTIRSDCANGTLKLKKVALDNWHNLCDAIKQENLSIKANSTFRTYKYQESLYNDYIKNYGKSYADAYAARPGFSEHQTGLALDVGSGTNNQVRFVYTKEYTWMKENSYKYGFILRYPEEKEDITGYSFEAWHYRYVGIDIATYLYENNLTFDEYIGRL